MCHGIHHTAQLFIPESVWLSFREDRISHSPLYVGTFRRGVPGSWDYQEEHRSSEEKCGEKLHNDTSCCYSDFYCYVSATFYVIKTDKINQKFLTGFLNSNNNAFVFFVLNINPIIF